MRVRVLLQITGDDGTASMADEVAVFEKVTERPEDLGLSIAAGKSMMAAIQRQVVDAQLVSWVERHRCCQACGARQRSKGSYPIIFMTLYMFDATGFFAALTALSRGGKAMDTIASMAGLSKTNPMMAIAITLLAFSAMGIPPLPGFWGKFYVFKAAIDAGQWAVAVAGLVSSVIAAFYYLRLVKVMWLDDSPGPIDPMPMDAKLVTLGSAIFAFPLVMIALTWIEPFAGYAANAFGLP